MAPGSRAFSLYSPIECLGVDFLISESVESDKLRLRDSRDPAHVLRSIDVHAPQDGAPVRPFTLYLDEHTQPPTLVLEWETLDMERRGVRAWRLDTLERVANYQLPQYQLVSAVGFGSVVTSGTEYM